MRTVSTLVGLLTLATPVASFAHRAPYWESGSLVGVSVEVEGQAAPLYPAPDGSGRLYLEARRGARYAIRLDNRSHERLGVALTVDGLNVISGDRPGTWRSWFSSDPGRMYVLEPYDSVLVQGWRTSLEDIRRFTFVDEERSYAARSGKANSKMGWIEVAVYRERRPVSWWWRPDEVTGSRKEKPRPYGEGETRDRADAHKDGEEDARSRADRAAPSSPRPPDAMAQGRSDEKAYGVAPRPESYPGTGWGQRTEDPAVVVAFEPERSPAERLTLRYEYAGGLRALGILTRPAWDRDRLWEREHARDGFAKPPKW